MEIRDVFGMSRSAGSVIELNVGFFFRGFEYMRLVTERVGKDGLATLAYKVDSRLVALFVFRNVGLDHKIRALNFASFLHRVDKVFIVRRSLAVQADKTDFYVGFLAASGKAEAARNRKHCGEQKC